LQTHIAVTMAAMGNPLAVKVLDLVKNSVDIVYLRKAESDPR